MNPGGAPRGGTLPAFAGAGAWFSIATCGALGAGSEARRRISAAAREGARRPRTRGVGPGGRRGHRRRLVVHLRGTGSAPYCGFGGGGGGMFGLEDPGACVTGAAGGGGVGGGGGGGGAARSAGAPSAKG